MAIDDEHLRRHRGRPAVLKVELSKVRAHERCRLVFVVEGRDDLKAFDVWIRRVSDGLRWEPLVAKGRPAALEFREMLERDLTGLKVCTYFLLDSDYEPLAGCDNVYSLPAYSIENLLTGPEVIDSLLVTEFQVVGDISLRQELVEVYGRVRKEFADLVRIPCEVLHATRKESCGAVNIVEACLTAIEVDLLSVEAISCDAVNGLITTEQTLTDEAMGLANVFFSERDPTLWVRGKYMYSFFKEWCQQLMRDRQADVPKLFPPSSLGKQLSLSGEWSAIGSLAARSNLPDSLSEFVLRANEECAAACS